MYEYIQSIEENKLTTQLKWSAIDKNNKKTKQKHALHAKRRKNYLAHNKNGV